MCSLKFEKQLNSDVHNAAILYEKKIILDKVQVPFFKMWKPTFEKIQNRIQVRQEGDINHDMGW